MKKRYEEYKEKYGGKKFLFRCKNCSKEWGAKDEFEFIKHQRKNHAVLQCRRCGYLISRHLDLLDKQIKEGKK